MKNKIINNKWIYLCLGIFLNILLFIPYGIYVNYNISWRFILFSVVIIFLYMVVGGIILLFLSLILFIFKIRKKSIKNVFDFLIYSLYIGLILHFLYLYVSFYNNLGD